MTNMTIFKSPEYSCLRICKQRRNNSERVIFGSKVTLNQEEEEEDEEGGGGGNIAFFSCIKRYLKQGLYSVLCQKEEKEEGGKGNIALFLYKALSKAGFI